MIDELLHRRRGKFGGTFLYARTDLIDRPLQLIAAAREIGGIPNHDFLYLARHWISPAIDLHRSVAALYHRKLFTLRQL